MWSLGVMTYLMLSGRLPFNANDETEIARQVAFEEPDLSKNQVWKTISKEAKSFIKGLLEKDAKKRMTIKQALDHEWIKKFSQAGKTSSSNLNKEDDKNTFKIYSSVDNK